MRTVWPVQCKRTWFNTCTAYSHTWYRRGSSPLCGTRSSATPVKPDSTTCQSTGILRSEFQYPLGGLCYWYRLVWRFATFSGGLVSGLLSGVGWGVGGLLFCGSSRNCLSDYRPNQAASTDIFARGEYMWSILVPGCFLTWSWRAGTFAVFQVGRETWTCLWYSVSP